MTIRSTFSLHTSKIDAAPVSKRADKFGFVRVELNDGRWVEVSVDGGQDFRVRASAALTIEPNCTNDLTLRVQA